MIERDAGAVKRFHTMRTIGDQTVAEHSFNVCMLLYRLLDSPSAELIKAALYHDLPEVITGDIPATMKWRQPQLNMMLQVVESTIVEENGWVVELSEEERTILKYVDMLELMLYCRDQHMLGNRFLHEVFYRGLEYLTQLPALEETLRNKVQLIVNDLCEEIYNGKR